MPLTRIHVAEGEEYDFDPSNPGLKLAMLLERSAGQTWGEWGVLMRRGSVTATVRLVYALRKESGKFPKLTFDDVDFDWGAFRMDELDEQGRVVIRDDEGNVIPVDGEPPEGDDGERPAGKAPSGARRAARSKTSAPAT